jgi:hypothetical protein
MDPHTGTISTPEFQNIQQDGQDVTQLQLTLDAKKSVFIRAPGPPPK